MLKKRSVVFKAPLEANERGAARPCLVIMSNLDDLFNKHKEAFKYKDLPHTKKPSRYFGVHWVADPRANRTNVSKHR